MWCRCQIISFVANLKSTKSVVDSFQAVYPATVSHGDNLSHSGTQTKIELGKPTKCEKNVE
jgi:hypothetical protein